ncbi:hypothetical protein SAMN05518849_110144 [Sphingobium sp. AP50]|nr:hypothetical protein SAMN05518849_110144 [Sphingobium sp. AP50]
MVWMILLSARSFPYYLDLFDPLITTFKSVLD